MPFWVYMLHCGDGSYYTGHTDSLEQRLEQHANARVSSYTSVRKPLTLVFAQDFSSREEALAMELRIKGWSRKKKEALMRGDWSEVKRLSRGRHRHERTGKRPSTSVAAQPTLRTNVVEQNNNCTERLSRNRSEQPRALELAPELDEGPALSLTKGLP